MMSFPAVVLVMLIIVSIVISESMGAISNLVVGSMSWVSDWNSTAVCHIWMVDSLSMEWHL